MGCGRSALIDGVMAKGAVMVQHGHEYRRYGHPRGMFISNSWAGGEVVKLESCSWRTFKYKIPILEHKISRISDITN